MTAQQAERLEARSAPRTLPNWTISLGVVLLVLAAWEGSARAGLVPALFLPPPSAVWAALVSTAAMGFADATLGQHLAASLGRVGAAFLLAAVFGVPLGLMMGRFERVGAAFDPLIETLRPIPPLAYLPLIIIWLGIGEIAKMTLIALAIFAPVVVAARAGAKSVPQERVRAAQSLGASRGQILRLVVLPNALPEILTGLRIGLAAGWTTLVAAELVAATRGLGTMILAASQFLVTDVVLAGIVVIAVVAFAIELGMRRLETWAAPWRARP